MYYLTFSHTKKILKTQTLAMLLVLMAGLLALGGTATLYAQSTDEVQQAPIPEENTASPLPDDAPAPSGDSTPDTGDSTSEPIGDGAGTVVTDETAVIDTGDATSHMNAETLENTNKTTSPPSSETTVTTENDASVATGGDTSALTGDNTAEGGQSANVQTGNAVSSVNVVNVVNTNIFNSTGLFYFLNMLMGNISLDVRWLFSVLTGDTPVEGGCALDEECTGSGATVTVNNTNNAVVSNDVSVTAATGGNSASASAGNASVQTGDAYASANVLNVVNTNITDSTYLLMTVNSFDAGSGNVIFPGADWFYELLAQGNSSSAGSQTTVTNVNDAQVDSNVLLDANTGENTASGASASVATGDATAEATVVNRVNQNIFGNSISFLFRIHGTWAGEIFGLPEGMSWRDTGDGVEIYFDESGVATAPAGSTDNLVVTNNNSAQVRNNVSIFALTGDNEVSAGAGDASVSTGDATASANIVNIVNTNVLGRNWVLAIFNIFGDWDGNIAFGQPDLWIGARALTTGSLRGGSCFEYEVTVNNLGDAQAKNVVLHGLYDTTKQTIETTPANLVGPLNYPMGNIASGKTRTVILPVCLSNTVRGQTTVTTEFEVDSTEDDADDANNREVIGVTTVASGGGKLRLGPAELNITKTADRDTILASSSVTYEITIKNTGDPVYNALLIDTIYDETGKPIHEQRWGLDTIKSHETIVVSYEAFFNEATTPGVYTNKAFISGTEHHPDYENNLGSAVESPVASVEVRVSEDSEEVTPRVCSPLLRTYISYTGDNDPQEVGKLQFFLRTMEGFSDLDVNNAYDEYTYTAVREFQVRYTDDILKPWGMTTPSGYVYYTTQKKINELWCSDLDFSLTDEQKREIETFKSRTRNFIERSVDIPEEEFERFGVAPSTPPQSTSRLATSEEPAPLPQVEETPLINAEDQVAVASEAFRSTATQSMWGSVRNRLTSAFSWLRF